MYIKMSKIKTKRFFTILTLFSLLTIPGCVKKYILVPDRHGDQRIEILESNIASVSEKNITIKSKAGFKNEFVVFRLSVENNSDADLILKKEDLTILDGNNVIQNILDEKQIENIYYDNLYISFFPTYYPTHRPYFYPDYRSDVNSYYRFSLDRKFFLKKLYKEIFKFGRIPPHTTQIGDIYIQERELITPVKLDIELAGEKFKFTYNKIKKSK